MDGKSKEMRLKRCLTAFVILAVIVTLWKLYSIESALNEFHVLKLALEIRKDQLQLIQQQLVLIEKLTYRKSKDYNASSISSSGRTSPTIYAITPTYSRSTQKADLIRISHVLRLVRNVHWILVEDAEEKTLLVQNLIHDTNLIVTHLQAKTPPREQIKDKDPLWKHHRGVEQRNTGLKWLRSNMDAAQDNGVVYFMDDDNTYSTRLFDEMAKVRTVGVWPVGLVGGCNAEAPIVDSTIGKVTGYKSGWKSNRPFAIDMAGFAINLKLILRKPYTWFSYRMEKGLQESEFLANFTTMEQLEPLAKNCSEVYVWHTRTEKPVIRCNITGLEV